MTDEPSGRLAPEVVGRIDAVVAAFVDDIAGLDVHGPDLRRRVEDIDGLAGREIRSSAEVSRRLLDRSLVVRSGARPAPVSQALEDLRRNVDELDPARHLSARKHRRIERQIRAVVASLEERSAGLEQDNAVIGQEERALSTQMETLGQYAELAARLDAAVEGLVARVEGSDPERAHALRDEVLFPVRQRREEIVTQLAVATQAQAALRLVAGNNRELIRAARSATTTTLAALRTAAVVAQVVSDRELDDVVAHEQGAAEAMDEATTLLG